MTEEIWRPIPDFEGLYEVSNYGNVRSFCSQWGKRKTPLKIASYSALYPTVCLPNKQGKRKTTYIHILVASVFIPNPDNLPEVNHKDGNKHNNHVSNLEWVTHQGNMAHARQHDLFGVQKPCVCVETGKIYGSITKAGIAMGLSQPRMSAIVHSNKPVKGLHFKIVEENK